MKNVLIGSVFANDLGAQPQWLDLQLKFINATTKNFDHIALVAEGLTTDYFTNKTTTITFDKPITGNEAHLNGLRTLLEYFKERIKEYSYFLFLDADAFPIRKNWFGDLTMKLQPTQLFDSGMAIQSRGHHREIAVALRAENLESRLHASILFAKAEALKNLEFVWGEIPSRDLMGNKEADIHMPLYETDLRDKAFPLMRSNQFNINPVACGIYYDMFYHHCCGSGRPFYIRGNPYWDRVVSPVEDTIQFTEQLMENPEAFVAKLAGWNPKRYCSKN
jgi:hypothetical protein